MIKKLLTEKINLVELQDFTKKKRTTHITNAKNKNTVFNCDVLSLRFSKIRAYSEMNELKEGLEILDTVPSTAVLAEFIGISKVAINKAKKKQEEGKNVYAYKLHLMTYRAYLLNKLLNQKKL